MKNLWDYKGLFWDEVSKDFYTWSELKKLWKNRGEQCQSTVETKAPPLSEK